MNDPAIELIDKRIKELVDEANKALLPYNVAIGELQKLRNALVPPEEPAPETEESPQAAK